jgi:hypothetical protein
MSLSAAVRAAAAAAALSAAALPAAATGPASVEREFTRIEESGGERSLGFRRGSFVVAPVPFSNPTIGAGLALGAGYLFKTDPAARTSTIGLGAMRSDNGSRAAGALANLAFGENRWLFEAFAAEADVRYDLFTGAGKIPVRQDGILARFNASYGVTTDLSFGAVLRYLDTTVTPETGLLPPPQSLDIGLQIASAGLTLDWDRRDNSDYPGTGFRLQAEALHSEVLNGLQRTYWKGSSKLDGYRSFGADTVLALRGTLCAAEENTPFFDQCSLGATDNFRGFNSTQFLDLRSFSLQAEIRRRLSKRWGAVGFAGTGWTGSSVSALTDGGSHSAFGLGARYRVSKKFPVDFSVDASRNSDGEDLLYIYVGQRF